MKRIKSAISIIHPVAILVFVATVAVILVSGQDTSRREVAMKQQQIEDKLDRLTNRSVEIASQTNENTKQLDRIDALHISASLASITATVNYDHNLIFAMMIAVLTMMLETALRWIVTLKRKAIKPGDEGEGL